jgi:hypothetical protein
MLLIRKESWPAQVWGDKFLNSRGISHRVRKELSLEDLGEILLLKYTVPFLF